MKPILVEEMTFMYVLIVKLIAINWVQSHIQEKNGCFITLANLYFYKLLALKLTLAISRLVARGAQWVQAQ